MPGPPTPSRPTASSPAEELALATAQALARRRSVGSALPRADFDGVFSIRNARLVGERHLKMWVELPRSGRAFDAIAFNHVEPDAQFLPPAGAAQLVYRLEVNEYQGERRLQLLVDHVLPAGELTARGRLARARQARLASGQPWKSISSRRQLKDLAERIGCPTGVSLSTTASTSGSRK